MNFITFTRKLGTGGSEIARRVADELHYSLYDTSIIENTARDMGFLSDIKEVDEKVPSLFERLFTRRPQIHLGRLNSVIYELASRGNAVFLGRGSHILLRTFRCALHVRVTASPETRIENLVKRGLQRDAAIRAIHRSDQERGGFTKFAFGVDWEDPELYDIVLNMDSLSVDLAVETALRMASNEEIKARSMDAMKSLEMMALTGRAEAALMEAGFSLVCASAVAPGRVQLTGIVGSEPSRAKTEALLRGVKGIESIDNQLDIPPLPAST